MSTLLTIPDAAELLAHTLAALKAAGYASAAMMPVHRNDSSEVEKTETPATTAPEVYVAPGKQYANAQEALAHMVRELKNPQRDNYNETLDFTFASLAQLLDLLREPIYQHGLMLKQEFEKGDELPLDMVTTFIHIPTGTEVSFRLPAYIKEDKRLDECQRVGASFTYFRRYGLRQALDITDGDDDIDQADSKRERRKARALNSSRKWKPTTSARTKPESILNVLVASGEFSGSAAIAQAKARNPFLRTPSELAEDFISGADRIMDDEGIARDTVARFGLTDTFWQDFYNGYRVDGDELVDDKTGNHVTADVAMAIAESITSWAVSAADANSVVDTRDMVSAATSPSFVPDRRPTTPEEEAFISAVGIGHDDEIAEIAERLLGADIAMGLDIKAERNDTRYARRNWLNACKVFYSNALLAGNVNFDALPSLLAQPEPQIEAPDEMQQKADIAREIAAGNSETDIKLQQLHEIAKRCDTYTASYIDTLILHVECDGLNTDLPVYIPESDLPY
ncbi:ERF family protein [Citrobacter freundii]|uniref:ERF family protein n=1 Tax=Citrobacter freundii TaxID=546 RepID=UPI0023AF85D1|nr:ERF family protein [Citrobacter freundii]EJY9173719.1 ERF family protein [Citrobacter freundii]EKT9389371.1 ERF family protein [Citrobacter freundii]EKU1806851.1 ERF family protein [Citrobacter freundii]EKW3168793.1 ERF family protein [Citrobacter freundii]EKX8164121.1 ERF family protein [Citrobacter freundii]